MNIADVLDKIRNAARCAKRNDICVWVDRETGNAFPNEAEPDDQCGDEYYSLPIRIARRSLSKRQEAELVDFLAGRRMADVSEFPAS